MADALLNPSDMDALLKKITSEVLAGVDKALENKIDPVLEKLLAIATHVEQVENRITQAEMRISAVEDTASRDNADLNEMKKKLDMALEKIDNLENRSSLQEQLDLHLDMPHLWGGWTISAKEKCSLTQI